MVAFLRKHTSTRHDRTKKDNMRRFNCKFSHTNSNFDFHIAAYDF